MKYKVTLNGHTYEVEVELAEAMLLADYEAAAPVGAVPAPAKEDAPVAEAPAAAPAPAVGGGTAVNAPMPGTILKVNVTQGQAVKEGELLCILEAMKMENEIVAPIAGTVSQVLVSKGSSVDTGATLVVIG